MTTLLYRGQQYAQHKEVAPKQPVELTYRRTVYANNKLQATQTHPVLTYRGHEYQKSFI